MTARIAQRPPVWISSLVTHAWLPIQLALAVSKNTARAMYTSSGVTAKIVASTTKAASGACRCDDQNRASTVFRTTAEFR